VLERTLNVRLRFIDPEFMRIDVYQSLVEGFAAVVWTLKELRTDADV
jgi:hypothetical protein